MKAVLSLSALLSFAVVGSAQSRIIAQISNVRNDRGVCRICLFNQAAAFEGDGGAPVQCLQATVTNGRSEAQFLNIPPGVYAVAVFHDANNNNKMDKNFFGIPKEGYGASRNKLPFAAAPDFDANKFTVPDKTTTTLRIRLRNL